MTKGLHGIPYKTYKILFWCCIWQTFAYASFSLCFAVSPIPVSHQGSTRVMTIHTVPFILVELANWTHALSETLYEHQSGYKTRLEFPIGNKYITWAYVVALSITTVGKSDAHSLQHCFAVR